MGDSLESERKNNQLHDNDQLRKDIVKFCHREDRSADDNILLLGKSGAGKSAIVNTLITALVGKYIPRAKVGKGKAQSKTLHLIRYDNCGLSFDDLRDSKYHRFLTNTYGTLPTIIDAAGLGDVDTPALREVLRLIIRGYIPVGTSITDLENLQKEHGIGNLQIIFDKASPERKINKIAFVLSCQDVVPPRKLIQCVHSVLESSCDIFVVTTRYDLVEPNNTNSGDDGQHDKNEEASQQENTEHEYTVTLDNLQNLEKELAKEFSIEGSTEHNMIRWTSYVDEVGYKNNPNIDKIALTFLKLMVTPGQPRQASYIPNITLWKRLKIALSTSNNLSISIGDLLKIIAIAILVLAIIFGMLIMSPGKK